MFPPGLRPRTPRLPDPRSARALKEMNGFAEALEELEKVLVVKPKNVPFLKEKGLVLNKMKRFDQALEAFEKAKEISPAIPLSTQRSSG